MVNTKNISIRKATTVSITETVKDTNGSAFDLTSYTMTMYVRTLFDSTTNIISKTATITTPSSGVGVISLTDTDTDITSKEYVYFIEITDNTNTYVTSQGIFDVNEDITNYCTVNDVSEFLQVSDYTSSTTPTIDEVRSLIAQQEDYIDNQTGHSWREKTVFNEYIDKTFVQSGLGIRCNLMNRQIRDIKSLEVWNGSSYEDYVSTKTEGRNNDYYVDYTNGVIFLSNTTTKGDRDIRVTYTYGDDKVLGDIKNACIKLVSIDVLNMLDKVVRFVDDGASNRPTHDRRIDYWKKDIDRILTNRSEYKSL